MPLKKSVLPRRFSIRTTFAMVLVVAVACRVAPSFYRRAKFADQYKVLREIEWKRIGGTAEGYEFRNSDGVLLSVWTTEHEYSATSGLAEPKSFTPDPTRFFVVPPGKWVKTIDDVVEEWDKHD